jgi:hypothetical protein
MIKCLVFFSFQRQKSLVIVNFIDLVVKVVSLTFTLHSSIHTNSRLSSSDPDPDPSTSSATTTCTLSGLCIIRSSNSSGSERGGGGGESELLFESMGMGVRGVIAFAGISAAANVVLGTLAWWKRFANLYLHWGALLTWALLFLQGKDLVTWHRNHSFSVKKTVF